MTLPFHNIPQNLTTRKKLMTQETTQTSQGLYQAFWNSADVLRSKMDANEYKSYLLGMVF